MDYINTNGMLSLMFAIVTAVLTMLAIVPVLGEWESVFNRLP